MHPSSPRAIFNELLLASHEKQGDEGLVIGRKLLSFPQVRRSPFTDHFFKRKGLQKLTKSFGVSPTLDTKLPKDEMMPGLYTLACNTMLELAESTKDPLRYCYYCEELFNSHCYQL